MSGKHVIHRQVFAFDIPDEQSYPAFARRISELQSSRLFDDIDALLSDLVPEGLHIRIERIELDVGALGLDELGDLLIRRIVEELRRQLVAERPATAALAGLQVDPATRDLRLLEHFVDHGRLPWWAPAQGTSIREVSARLLRGDLRTLRPLFGRLRHDPVRLRRWIGHVDTRTLVPLWKPALPAWAGLSDADALRLVEAAIRLSTPGLGGEASRDAIRYGLLSDLLETDPDPHAPIPNPANPLSLLRRATPFSGRADLAERFRHLHARDARWRRPTPASPSGRPLGPEPSPPPPPGDMSEFRSFLRTGHLERYRSRSMLTELVRLFRRLVSDELPPLEDAIRDLGRSERVRRRLLDNIASPDIRHFFERAVPGKKDLLDWVANVYLETQRKLRPINQTDIRVKRSVDEITLEIYTSTDLNAITNEAFLRQHLRRMALRHHLRYEDLLRRIVESVAMPPLPLSSRFVDLLRRIYAEDVFTSSPAPGPALPGDAPGEALLAHLYRSAEALPDLPSLRARLRQLARVQGRAYGQLLADLAPGLDRPPVPVAPAFVERLRRLVRADRPAPAVPMSGPGPDAVSRAVADVFALPEASVGLSGPAALRARLERVAGVQGISYARLLAGIAAGLDRPPPSAPPAFVERLRRLVAEPPSPPLGETSPGESPPDGRLLDVLAQAGLAGITGEAGLRARLRRIAAGQGLAYDALLRRLAAYVAAGQLPASDPLRSLLHDLSAKDAPADGTHAPAEDAPPSGRIPDVFLREVVSSPEWAALEDASALRRHLHRVAARRGVPYRELLSRLADVVGDGYPAGPVRVVGLLRQVHREDIPSPQRSARLAELPGGTPGPIPGEGPAFRHMAEPVPDELLRLLTREVMRALVLAKGTGIFGKSTRAVQDLITAYIRLGGAAPMPEGPAADELVRRLSAYLDMEPGFLAFAMGHAARLHPEDGPLRDVAAFLSAPPLPAAGGGRRPSEADVIALVAHLTQHRVYYDAAQVKALVLPALKAVRIGRELFAAVLRLLFEEDAPLVEATLRRVLVRSAGVSDPTRTPSVTPADHRGDAAEAGYRAFLQAVLDVRNTPFSLNRVFAEVRRRLQPDREEPFVLPTRLSEVKGFFVRDDLRTAAPSGGRSKNVRENAIIRLYNILHLDLLLEGAGPRFFDNIPFSFELLLTRHRQQLLDILHVKRLDPELAHFFAYADRSRLFEQIRALYPRARVERVTRTFGHAVDLLHRSRWLNLDREQSLAFGMLDAYAHVFSRDDTEPLVSDIVLDILHRAAEARLLSRAFVDVFRDPDDAAVLRQLGRRLGWRRLERLLPTAAGVSDARAEAFRQRVRLFRDLLPEGAREAREGDVYLSLSAILEAGVFPAGHPFEGQSLESQSAYLAAMPLSGRVLARLLSDRPPRHPAAVLLGTVGRPLLVSTLVLRFGVDRTTVARLFAFWSARAVAGGMAEEELMREVLLRWPAQGAGRGVEALRRSILAFLTATGRLSYWQALAHLPEEGIGPLPPTVHRLVLPAEGEGLPGAEPWYEFYFGVLTDGAPATSEGYRAVHAWAEYLFRHPAGRTRRRLLAILVEAFLRAREGAGGSPGSLHPGFLEALRPFDGLREDDARRVLRALLAAGVPPDALAGHLAGRRSREGTPLSELTGGEVPLPSSAASAVGRQRGVLTPREVLAGLSRPGGPAGRVLAGLRRWVDGRTWLPSDVGRFEALLPPLAFDALLRSLSPAPDLPRIVEAWAAVFRATGWRPDARKARLEVLGLLFARRLWRHRSASAIHAALLAASGIARALREGRLAVDPAGPAAAVIPDGVWRRLPEMPEGEEGEVDADEVAEAWALSLEARAATDPRPAAGRPEAVAAPEAEAIAFFLETGLVPGLGRVARTSPEYLQYVGHVAAMGVARFLSHRRLHRRHEASILDFFPAALLTQHVFGVLARQASDPVLREFLRTLAAGAAGMRVRLATLVRFLRLFRSRVATRPGLGPAGVEAFLEEALRIPGFEALAGMAAQALPVGALRDTRSRFLRRTQRELRRRYAPPVPQLDDAVWFFLRTGMLRPSLGVETVDQLAERLQERVRAGDRVFREMLFTRVRQEAARRRVRRLLAGLEARELNAFLHPALDRELTDLARLMRQRFGVDVWRAVGARTERDRVEKVLHWWSATRARPDTPMRILRLFMTEASAALDPRQLARIRRPPSGGLTAAEREVWAELRALVPAWLEVPPDEDRRLRKPREAEDAPARNDPEPAPDPAEGIPVRNGGLVMLWPFLGRLFSRLQLTDGKQFLGDGERSRAIRLTQYLVTGRTDMEEHQLALNKVLCGAPLDFDVPADLDVSPEEADLCLKMLQGAIRNWEKLKTTRPDTFRETFLRREAILYRVDERWELVVQRKPYDMLLDTLPWNISMIQLSWMPDRLVVQWK